MGIANNPLWYVEIHFFNETPISMKANEQPYYSEHHAFVNYGLTRMMLPLSNIKMLVCRPLRENGVSVTFPGDVPEVEPDYEAEDVTPSTDGSNESQEDVENEEESPDGELPDDDFIMH